MSAPARIVVADANVLINLVNISRLDLCAQLAGFEFVIPDHVRAEILLAAQRLQIDQAIKGGVLRLESITDLAALTDFTEFLDYLGRGEAACLALAAQNGWSIASDEKRRFRRAVEARLGKGRIFGTADLLALAIQAGRLTIAEADRDKHTLEQHRFKMDFVSFGNIVSPPTPSTGE
ncbi:MAG: hypothetical protein SF066_22665 [Thermoanaerobaculia bacterium]|nr:hypothetical protein [Thermoanaerobaculia bacterium]